MRWLLLLLLLAPLPGSADTPRQVVFNTFPSGASIYIERPMEDSYIGRSGRPVSIPEGDLNLRFELAGYMPRREHVSGAYFLRQPVYPDPGLPPIRLDPRYPLLDTWYVLTSSRWFIPLVVVFAAAVTWALMRWRTVYQRLLRQLRVQAVLRPASSDIQVGRQFGNYMLVSRLSTGGTATVYRAIPAESLDESEAVAIKVLSPELCLDPGFRPRFEREIRIGMALHHPNIIHLVDWGETADGQLYLVMELGAGITLSHQMQRHPLSRADVLHVMRQLTEAVAYAHSQGVVHRDLKPGNVLIDDTGRVKILDFGYARAHDMATVTRPGSEPGTPAYMAPETVSGHKADAAVDQYALGVMAFEMLAGQRPFDDDAGMLYRKVMVPAPPLKSVADVSDRLSDVVARMLAIDPKARYADVSEAFKAFEAAF